MSFNFRYDRTMELPLVVELKGRDRLEVISLTPFKMRILGCENLHKKLNQVKLAHVIDISQWPLQKETDHVSLLINELILKLQGKWKHPYPHDEVCHCRTVSLETVEQAILNGAHSTDMVSRWTQASTACGTCQPDVEKILKFRLLKSASRFTYLSHSRSSFCNSSREGLIRDAPAA